MRILPISRNTKTNQIEAKQQTKTNKPNTSYLNNIKTEQTNFKGNENIKPEFDYGYTLKELENRLTPKKYTKHELLSESSVAYKTLTEGDKQALEHLIRVAECFDSVYKRLDNVHNLDFEKFLNQRILSGDKQAILTKKLYDGQKGIIGKTTEGDDVVLAKGIKELPGKGFYPEDLTEKELQQIIIRMIKENRIDEVRKILNQRSIVFRDGEDLKAFDYTEYFKKEFTLAAKELEAAAKTGTNKDFNEYLILQAKALRENNPLLDCAADKKWATLQDTPLELTIGRECYSDKMTPTVIKNRELKELLEKYNIPVYAKDNIGVRVGIVDKKGTNYLLKIKELLPIMAKAMPYSYKYTQTITKGNSKQTMVDAHIVAMSGANAAYRGGISIASNLPNADKLAVQTGGGHRTVYNKELREAKYANGIEEKLNAILDISQHKYFNVEALHDFTILHENMHSLGPKEGLENLGIYKNTIEEHKADMGSIAMLNLLKEQGYYSENRVKEILTSWVVAYTQKGADFNDAHKTRNIMQHNYFIQNQGIAISNNGKMIINFEKIIECAKAMLDNAIRIQLSKNSELAKNYINKYAVWTDELELLAKELKNSDTRINSYIYSPIAKKFKIHL